MNGVRRRVAIGAALVVALAQQGAQADVRIGVTVSAAGPAASLGIPEKNSCTGSDCLDTVLQLRRPL